MIGAQTQRRRSAAEIRANLEDLRAQEEARYRAAYGRHLADAVFLRQRGYMVTKSASGLCVEGRLVDNETFKAIVDRERRLAGGPAEGSRASVPLETQSKEEHMSDAQCGCGRAGNHKGRCWVRRGLTGPEAGKSVAPRATGKALAIYKAPAPASGDVAAIDGLIAQKRAEAQRLEQQIEGLEMARGVLSANS